MTRDSGKPPDDEKRMAPAKRKPSLMVDGPDSFESYGEEPTDRPASGLCPEAVQSLNRIFRSRRKPERDSKVIPFPKPYREDD